MTTPSKRILARQLEGVEKWLPVIKAAAEFHGVSPELLLAIGSRETNLNPYYQSHSGDGGNGYSMWQIDKRSYPAFVASGDWRDVAKAVNKAADVLSEKLVDVRTLGRLAGLRPEAGSDAELRIAVAAYNTGAQRAFRSWQLYGTPDRTTTGKDYSSDVMTRRNRFVELLTKQPEAVDVPTDLPGDVKVPAVVEKPEEAVVPSLQSIVTGHSDSLKAVGSRAAIKIGRWIAMLWLTTWGRTFLIIVAIVILSEIVYNLITYWPKIREAVTAYRARH